MGAETRKGLCGSTLRATFVLKGQGASDVLAQRRTAAALHIACISRCIHKGDCRTELEAKAHRNSHIAHICFVQKRHRQSLVFPAKQMPGSPV